MVRQGDDYGSIHSNAHQYANRDSDEHADFNADEHAHQYADQYSHLYTDQYADRYLHANEYADEYAQPNSATESPRRAEQLPSYIRHDGRLAGGNWRDRLHRQVGTSGGRRHWTFDAFGQARNNA